VRVRGGNVKSERRNVSESVSRRHGRLAVGGDALRISSAARSDPRMRGLTAPRHAGQLFRPVAIQRSTHSRWNACLHAISLHGSSGA
jgi:hypothetical protein